jgi:hypothetical protein
MPIAISARFRFSAVNAQHYRGRRGILHGAENNTRAIERIARANGFQTRLFLIRAATRAAFESVWPGSIMSQGPGDMFLVTIAGDVGQLRARENTSEATGQMLCLFDGEWLDNETNNLLFKLSTGVRACSLIRTCRSETLLAAYSSLRGRLVSRALPQDVATRTYQANRGFHDSLVYSSRRTRGPVKPCTIAIPARRDYEEACDSEEHGTFTEMLLRTWPGGGWYR